jgi:hypothetical protein
LKRFIGIAIGRVAAMSQSTVLAITALAAVLVLWSLSANDIEAIKPAAQTSTRGREYGRLGRQSERHAGE